MEFPRFMTLHAGKKTPRTNGAFRRTTTACEVLADLAFGKHIHYGPALRGGL
jgi:hypothetical protein